MKTKITNILKKVIGWFLILQILAGIIAVGIGIYTSHGIVVYAGIVNIAVFSSILWLCGRWEKKLKANEKV